MKMMMSSGRTPEQGAQLYYKDTPEYSRETSYCFLHPMDCMEIGVEEGDHVLIRSTAGETVFYVRESPETPEGVVFIPCVLEQSGEALVGLLVCDELFSYGALFAVLVGEYSRALSGRYYYLVSVEAVACEFFDRRLDHCSFLLCICFWCVYYRLK